MRLRVRSPWFWIGLGAFALVGFIVFEAAAIMDPEGLTLSQFIYNITNAWRPLIFLFGLLTGMLVTHFWWPWVPKQLRATCVTCGETILLPLKKDR